MATDDDALENEQIEIVVDLSLPDPQRLDKYLGTKLTDFSRAYLQKLIDSELVVIDGKPAKQAHKLKGGEIIHLSLPPDIPLDLVAEDIPLDILYEDEYLIVINKQAGLVTHPGAGVHQGTLVNALLHHCQGKLSGISGVLRPGIVHRLDKDTSGILVVAKEDKTHRSLQAQIKEKSAKRVYTALLEGILPAAKGTIDKPIGRHSTKRKQMAIVDTGRAARSHYEVLKTWSKYSLVSVQLETGRTHQIRVHMASLNCPVVGDPVYNHKSQGTLAARQKLGLTGQALHAAYLSFMHPITGELLEFVAPLPPDFANLVNSLDN
jgi:23S rRNA pseudouridine1911/1915/1917 synthase